MIFVLVVAVLWCSGTAGVREIVKETPILVHETRFGVGRRTSCRSSGCSG